MFRDRFHFGWLGVVAVLTAASVDWWWWGLETRIGGWLPAWIVWSMLLQFALAFALYRLGKGATDE